MSGRFARSQRSVRRGFRATTSGGGSIVVPTLSLTTSPSGAIDGQAFGGTPVVQTTPVTPGVLVTASIASGTGSLVGTTTATTDSLGRATFTTLGVDASSTPSNFTLTFSAVGWVSVTSGSFTVSAAGASFPNEPTSAGWTTHVDWQFTFLPDIKWSTWQQCLQVVTDATAPGGHGTVLRHWHPAIGATLNGQVWNTYYDGGSTAAWMPPVLPANAGALYFAYDIKYSSNWWHPAGAGHKHWYLNAKCQPGTVGDNAAVYDSLHFFAWVDNPGGSAGRLLAKFGTQWGDRWEAAQDNAWINEETGKALAKDTWLQIEYLVLPNTYGNWDGKMYCWVDGVLHGMAKWYSPFHTQEQVDHFPNFRPSAEWPSAGWYSFEFVPIFSYGDLNGSGPLPSTTQYFDIARFRMKYLSGTLTP